jgi:hypothetical protein
VKRKDAKEIHFLFSIPSFAAFASSVVNGLANCQLLIAKAVKESHGNLPTQRGRRK